MTDNLKQRLNYPKLVIHSTDNSFGFGYRKNNHLESDELFIKNFDNDLCKNLIIDFNKFISIDNLKKVRRKYNISSRTPIVITGSGKLLAVEIQNQLKCQTVIYSGLFSKCIKIPRSKLDDVDSCATAFSLAISTYL